MAFMQFDVPYTVASGAFTAATAKTVVGVAAPTNQVVKVLEVGISFDGAVSTAVPVLTECVHITFATNAPGTNSSSVTPLKRDPGRPETVQSTAGQNWTTEPTVITSAMPKYVGAFNGLYHYIMPFASPQIIPGGKGFGVRVTEPAVVDCNGHMTCEE